MGLNGKVIIVVDKLGKNTLRFWNDKNKNKKRPGVLFFVLFCISMAVVFFVFYFLFV